MAFSVLSENKINLIVIGKDYRLKIIKFLESIVKKNFPLIFFIFCVTTFFATTVFAFSRGQKKNYDFNTVSVETAMNELLVEPLEYKSSENKNFPSSFIIQKKVLVDNQNANQCAACSSAYVMRFYGLNADGLKLYKKFPCKFTNGYIAPKGIQEVFAEKKEFETFFYTGSVDNLKEEVSKGHPVIVLVQYENGSLHYIPVVGYDEENLYFQDSVPANRNNKTEFYNESISISQFEKMWKIDIPWCTNLFISVYKK